MGLRDRADDRQSESRAAAAASRIGAGEAVERPSEELRREACALVPHVHVDACVVVHDRLYVSGRLHERTTDWYTQDKEGNVWYYGEQTATFAKNGHVESTEGTWRAGKDGAVPGIYMPAHPKAGYAARQEFLKGHAEDHFRVLDLHTTVKVPWGTSDQALLTKEWTPLEPGVVDHKYYVRGVGTVLEQTVSGGTERNELVSFKPAS